jgi:hypothetical protein
VAYEDREAKHSAELLFDLAIGLAALKHGICYGGDDKVFVEELIWRDESFGMGVWFLGLLCHGSARVPAVCDEADMTDILLGIYFLSGVELTNGRT